MKTKDLLTEMRQSFHTHPDHHGLERDGFKLHQDEEFEDDNRKIFHYITTPDGKDELVDHSPYEYLDQAAFDMYIAFYKHHGRFPNRKDMNSIGPINKDDLPGLVDSLHEGEQTLMPAKTNESTVRRLASQIVRTACKNFSAERELTAAKQMGRDFGKRLMANIEIEYDQMKLKSINEMRQFHNDWDEGYSQKMKDKDDWSADYDPEHGMSYNCPNCGSHEVHHVSAPGNVMAWGDTYHLECENCGHRSNWTGNAPQAAEKKFGHPSKQPHSYHDPDAKVN